MKKQFLIAAATSALLASTSLTFAQMSSEKAPAGGAGTTGTQVQSPAGTSGVKNPAATGQTQMPKADSSAAKSDGGTKTTTGAQVQSPAGTSGVKNPAATGQPESGRKSEAPASSAMPKTSEAQMPKAGDAKAGSSMDKKAENTTTGAQVQSPAGSSGVKNPAATGQPQSGQAQAPSGSPAPATASSQTNVNVSLTADERTRIHKTVISAGNAPRMNRTDVKFSLNVGTVVPRSVHVAILPAAVVEIHPAWRGYQYLLVGDEIVILEPGSLRIVAIIPA